MNDRRTAEHASFVHRTTDSGLAPSGRLGRLDVELTERCDNDCVHCCICLPEDHEEARRREMTTAEVVDLLEQACELGALSVRYTGGEPLLRDDFEELYLAARRRGLKVLLFTNARRITPGLADLFARVPPLERIEVTVYGMREESYEAVSRRRGSYAEFRRGVSLLEERGVPFILKSAWLPANRGDLEELDAWAAANPAMDGRRPNHSLFFELRGRRRPTRRYAAALPATASGGLRDTTSSVGPDDPPVATKGLAEGGRTASADDDGFWWPDPARRNELVRSLRPSPPDGVAFMAGRDRERYLADMRQFCAKFMAAPGDRLFSCGSGHGVCVDAYGVAQMCLPLRHPDTCVDLRDDGASDDLCDDRMKGDVSGSVDRGSGDRPPQSHGPAPGQRLVPGSLRRALTDAFPRLRELRATDPDYLATCAHCFLKGLCEQCPGKSWSEHGALDRRVEYLCDVAHEQARDLGLLSPGECAWEVADADARVAALSRSR